MAKDPERPEPVAEERGVEPAEVELLSLLCLHVRTQLEQHQLAERVGDVRRVEAPAFGLATRAGLFQQGLFAEEPDALFDGQVLGVQPQPDHEA